MGTQTAPIPSFARFTRNGFGFTPRLRTDSKNKSRNTNSDDEWYIPYNGPYELPKDTAPRRHKARDSWGDPVDGWEYDTGLDDKELHLRYGGGMEEERKGRSRDRTFSVISARTTSSDAVDPSRVSMRTATMKRRSTISSGSPPMIPPSFISLDAIRGGGVGESPIPPSHRPTRRRHSKDSNPNNRMSIASIFSFGGRSGSSRRESPASLSGRKPIVARLNTKQERERTDSGAGNKQRKLHDQVLLNRNRRTSDDEDYYNSYYSTLLTPTEKLEADRAHRQVQERVSPVTPTSGSSISPGGGGVASRHNSASTNSGHPYAYVFPQILTPIASAADITHSAPITPANNAPRLTFTTTPSPSGGFSPRIGVNAGTTNSKLKGSTSTPNLRDSLVGSSHIINTTTATTNEPQAVSTFAFPKGKDKWLSAETWCDALLFPRPRLKVKQQPPPEEERSGLQVSRPSTSGRIVSPPTTPLAGAEFGVLQRSGGQQREPGVASRVLAHSRSLVDLRNETQVGKEKDGYEDISGLSNGVAVVGDTRTTSTTRAPRPTSWAQDDLSLPAPVPSLAHVLREGEQLDLDRRAWKRQATQSFGNKHARSVSRTRSKSLTQKGRRNMGVGGGGHHHQSSMDYIAARAYLGSQGVAMTPTIVHLRPNTSSSDGYTTTTTTGTHSHSSSLAKTLSKSSKSHSRTDSHSRSDSWSKSAIKMAKATVVCVYPNAGANADRSSSIIGTGSFRGPPDLEGALRKESTRVIRLADPAHLPLDRGVQPLSVGASSSLGHANQPLLAPPTTNYAYTRKTPSPSGYESIISESKVGIALGTPPPGGDGDSDAEAEYVNYVPSHPYAQGGLSFSAGGGGEGQPGRQHGDFAGAHPSVVYPPSTVGVQPISEILARHKLSPHIAALHMVPHPYAQAQRDSYIDASGLIGQHRSEGTPHAAKMWAQLSPGVVREILADDLKYSPYLEDSDVNGTEARDDDDNDDGLRERPASNIHYTVGPAGGLVNPARFAEVGDNPPPGFGGVKSRRRNGVHLVPSRSMDLGKLQQLTFEHTLESSQPHVIDYTPNSTQERLEANEEEELPKFISNPSSSNSSSPRSPPILDSPHDLENFQDLFYRPNGNNSQRTPDEAALPDTPSSPRRVPISPKESNISWEKLRNRRTGSGLTSLARHLSNEFEQLSLERTSSLYSNSNLGSKFDYESHRRSQSATASLSSRHQSGLSGVFGGTAGGGLVRRPTLEGSSLHFVFEEVMPSSESPPNDHEGMGLGMGLATPIHAFNPSSDTLPEDVSASSFMENNDEEEEEEEDPAMFRVGMVESSSTPPVVSSIHRNSFLGDVHNDNTDATGQHQEQEQSPTNENDKELEQEYYTQEHHATYRRPRPEEIESPEPRTARVLSGLHPPTDATRSSYMTTSTTSRMSALSDFPVPPMSHHHQDNNNNDEDENETARIARPEQRPQDLTTPRPMSLLSSYFNEARAEGESRVTSRLDDIRDSPALRSAVALLEDHRLAFAVHQERGY